MLTSTDPRTGTTLHTSIVPSSPDDVQLAAELAASAALVLASKDRRWRADLLESLAMALEERRQELVLVATQETGLTEARLNGELTRTVFQLQLFAEAVREGSFLEAAIDHAADTPLGPAPDVRRILVGIGPVAVFGSSNFPFAFSVPGGDTASAIAAGNPVVVKAHSAHVLTSKTSFEALLAGCERAGAPEGTIGIVYGQEAGGRLVGHPSIAAVGFTGSLYAAQQLQRIIQERETPIPLYGELQSVNPLFVTPGALEARGESIATALAASITGSAGQLCTKPGLVFVPEGPQTDAFVARLGQIVRQESAHILLNGRVLDAFNNVQKSLSNAAGVTEIAVGAEPTTVGLGASARVLGVSIEDFSSAHVDEAFGPLVMVVRYGSVDQLVKALNVIPGSLTASIHSEADEESLTKQLTRRVTPLVGRILFNGFPTGVRVSWAQHHGGPWPSTNSIHSSVGVTAMRRFLRPVVWQDAPQAVLPEELRDDYSGVARRVDGALTLPSTN